MMSIANIRNPLVRKATIVVTLPFLLALGLPIMALIAGFLEVTEVLAQMPKAIGTAWKGPKK